MFGNSRLFKLGESMKLRDVSSKFLSALSVVLLLLIPIQHSSAAAVQADVDYSTQVSKLTQEMGTAAADWSSVLSEAPTLAVGKKFSDYKKKATSASNKFLGVIKSMKALKASPGFSKSGPMLVSSMSLYEKAVNQLITAINKNDKKLISKATTLSNKASKSYLEWSKEYAAEVAVLNG